MDLIDLNPNKTSYDGPLDQPLSLDNSSTFVIILPPTDLSQGNNETLKSSLLINEASIALTNDTSFM